MGPWDKKRELLASCVSSTRRPGLTLALQHMFQQHALSTLDNTKIVNFAADNPIPVPPIPQESCPPHCTHGPWLVLDLDGDRWHSNNGDSVEWKNYGQFTVKKKKVSYAGRTQLASPHHIVYCYSFILRAHGHLAAMATPSISDSSQVGGHPCCAHLPEGFQGGAAARAALAIDPRNPPGFLAAHCGDAARLAGRCGRSVCRVAVGFGR
ncbi:hypothetical protein F5888DRAFT_876568 [Russula emetica]|nr:hypothetical protein F5888DRAFT_876568 [Russula emetica]